MQGSLSQTLDGAGSAVIRRNEGQRFRACLPSLPDGFPAVYVDSRSTYNSVANAETADVQVVHLPTECGFTAARARSLGRRTLLHTSPNLHFVQFSLIRAPRADPSVFADMKQMLMLGLWPNFRKSEPVKFSAGDRRGIAPRWMGWQGEGDNAA